MIRVHSERYVAVMSFLIGFATAMKQLHHWYWSSIIRSALACLGGMVACAESYTYLAAVYSNHSTIGYSIIAAAFVFTLFSAWRLSVALIEHDYKASAVRGS